MCECVCVCVCVRVLIATSFDFYRTVINNSLSLSKVSCVVENRLFLLTLLHCVYVCVVLIVVCECDLTRCTVRWLFVWYAMHFCS